MAGIVSVVIIVLVLAAFAILAAGDAAEKRQERTDDLRAALRNIDGFRPNRVLVGSDRQELLAIDENSGRFAIARRGTPSLPDLSEQLRQLKREGRSKEETKVQLQKIVRSQTTETVSVRAWTYDALIAVEIVEDGLTVTTTSRTSQLGGALVGGLALGGVGMLAGALTGSNTTIGQVTRIELLVKLDDMSEPVHRITLHAGRLDRTSPQYKAARGEAEKWAAVVAILVRKAETAGRDARPLSEPTAPTIPSVADELKKLADLVKDGVISEEEFTLQKSKLLSQSP